MTRPASNTLGSRLAAEVRAAMARQRCTQEDLAVALGLSQAAVSRRLSGIVPFTVPELEAAAARLQVPVAALLTESAEPAVAS